MLTRRSFLALSSLAGLGLISSAQATDLPAMKVYKSPTCGCCGLWVDHVRKAGFSVDVQETQAVWGIKQRLGVPEALASCHTAQVGPYIIEGHVPASAIKRLLREEPKGAGLAVPGMPIGSPGMEVAGREPEVYDVLLFTGEVHRVFARYKGVNPV